MSGTPPRTQSLEALQRGNQLRLERAMQKGAISKLPRKAAFDRVAEILMDPPSCCVRATPFELLTSVERVGRHFALRWLGKAGLRQQEGRRIEELTVRQRSVLAGLLRESEGRQAA